MKTDDPKFTELALRSIAGKATEAEQVELRALLAQPELAEEFKQLKADTAFAKETLPLLGEEPVAVPPLTDFELSQMRRLAEQREKRIGRENEKSTRSWRWVWGLATATAVVAIVMLLNLPTPKTTVQFAMLDSMGTMRGGTNDVTVKLVAALQDNFGQTNFTTCSGSKELNQWLTQWPAGRAFKLVYDRDNAEVRILSKINGSVQILKAFPVAKENDLPAILKQAIEAIQQLSKSKQ